MPHAPRPGEHHGHAPTDLGESVGLARDVERAESALELQCARLDALGIGVFGPLADRFTGESVLVAFDVVMLLVVATAVALPSGRRAMTAADEHAQG